MVLIICGTAVVIVIQIFCMNPVIVDQRLEIAPPISPGRLVKNDRTVEPIVVKKLSTVENTDEKKPEIVPGRLVKNEAIVVPIVVKKFPTVVKIDEKNPPTVPGML